METFAEKVRSGGGIRFDPMLEEKGGWVAGEDPKRDEVMAEAVIEELAQASEHTHEGHFNPFREQYGEILPTNLERNFSGFLVRKDAITFKVDPLKVKERIAFLKDQLLIAKFVGPKPTFQDMDQWLEGLNQRIGDNVLSFCMNVGKGYFFLKGEDPDALNHALMLSPYKSKWGTCMIQSWVPGFDPDNPSNLAFPTWVALRRLPFEHHNQAIDIAGMLGEVIGIDTANESARDPRFCVNLMVSKGWVTSIDLETEDGSLPPQKILVDYDKLPMRCKVCHNWKHRVRDCQELQRRPSRNGRRINTAPHSYKPDKGKSIEVDEDGFQPVKNRKKNMRRNIFEKGNPAGSTQQTNSGYPDEQYRAREGAQVVAEELETPAEPLGGQGTSVATMEQSLPLETNSNRRSSQSDPHPCSDNVIPQTGGVDLAKSAVPSSEEGRGDPTSTMLWSPEKISRNKRTLTERAETDAASDTNSEDGSEEDAGEETDSEEDEGLDDQAEEELDNPEPATSAEEMAMDGEGDEHTTEGRQSFEGGSAEKWQQDEQMAEASEATETGALDSAPLNPGMLHTNHPTQATGTQ